MGIANWLGIGKEIAKPIEAIGDLYTTDKERLAAQQKLEATRQEVTQSQLDINKLLINSGNFFNSAWISLIGWSAGFLVLLYYAPQLIIITYVWGKNCIQTNQIIAFPMKSDEILNLVYLIFGVGGLGIVKNKLK